MALQQNVNIYQAAAVAGDRASMNPVIYTPRNYLAGEGGVKVGGFVWEAGDETDPEGVVATGSGAPLGFVERAITNFNYAVEEDGTLQIAQGGLVAVAVFGDFWVEAPEAVAKGAAVYADASTGAVSFSSGEATPYVTASSAEAGELVIISAWAGVVSAVSGSTSSGGGGSVDLSGYMKTDFSNATGTLGVANGGTGLSAVGTAGQVLATNSGATGIEWANVSTDVDHSAYMTTDFANATGTLGIEHGGTGLTSVGTDGQVLTSTGSALNYEAVPTQDLSGYATTEQLSEISSTLSTVSSTLSEVSSELEDCAKTSDLADYATTASLSEYAKTADLGDLATKNTVTLTSDVTGTLPLANGGTNATTADAARTALGLGSVATLSSVDLTNNVTGILPTANGGTGNTTGNAATATQLATARTITLEGDVTGSASFDGSANVTITTTAAASEDDA